LIRALLLAAIALAPRAALARESAWISSWSSVAIDEAEARGARLLLEAELKEAGFAPGSDAATAAWIVRAAAFRLGAELAISLELTEVATGEISAITVGDLRTEQARSPALRLELSRLLAPKESAGSEWPGWALIGGGVALGVAGFAAHLASRSAVDDFEQHLDGAGRVVGLDREGAQSLEDRARTFAIARDAVLIGAAASIAGGAILLLRSEP
jgi:hypothetical protein